MTKPLEAFNAKAEGIVTDVTGEWRKRSGELSSRS